MKHHLIFCGTFVLLAISTPDLALKIAYRRETTAADALAIHQVDLDLRLIESN